MTTDGGMTTGAALSAAGGGAASSEMSPEDYNVVKSLPGNDKCADCGDANPQWASASFGTVLCIECAGKHRGLGVHISFVRSINMDAWTPSQVEVMKCGGNDRCNEYLQNQGNIDRDTTPLKYKYDNDTAMLYKLVLKARAGGEEEPTELPKRPPQDSSKNKGDDDGDGHGDGGKGSAGKKGKRKMEGFGSDPNYRPPNKKGGKRGRRFSMIAGAAVTAGGVISAVFFFFIRRH